MTMAQLYAEASGRSSKQSVDPKHVLAVPAYDQAASAHVATAHEKLLPIGEGAYVSAEAVEQRTKDSRRHCEDGHWNGCFGKDRSDLLDGHSYGNMAPPTTEAP